MYKRKSRPKGKSDGLLCDEVSNFSRLVGELHVCNWRTSRVKFANYSLVFLELEVYADTNDIVLASVEVYNTKLLVADNLCFVVEAVHVASVDVHHLAYVECSAKAEGS